MTYPNLKQSIWLMVLFLLISAGLGILGKICCRLRLET